MFRSMTRGPEVCLVDYLVKAVEQLTPLSTTASVPTRTMSTRSMIYATAESRTTVHGIPAAVRI